MKTIAAVALASLVLFGCAPSAADEEADESGGAVVGSADAPLVKGASAVEVTVDGDGSPAPVTIAAPRKLNALVASLRKANGTAGKGAEACTTAREGRYRSLDLRFLDASGKAIATASLACSGEGTLKAGGRTTRVTAGPELGEIIAAPIAVGDALWGITEILVHDIFNRDPAQTLTESAEIAKVVKAFQVEQSLRPRASTEADCSMSYVLTFVRGTRPVADSALVCLEESGRGARAVDATFVVRAASGRVADPPVANGRIAIDPRPVVALFPPR